MLLISLSTVLWLGREFNSRRLLLQSLLLFWQRQSQFLSLPLFPMSLFYTVLKKLVFITLLQEGHLQESIMVNTYTLAWEKDLNKCLPFHPFSHSSRIRTQLAFNSSPCNSNCCYLPLITSWKKLTVGSNQCLTACSYNLWKTTSHWIWKRASPRRCSRKHIQFQRQNKENKRGKVLETSQ